MKNFISKVTDFIVRMVYGFFDVFSPAMCVSCDKIIADDEIFCDKCKKHIVRTADDICIKCGHAKKNCQCGNFVYHFEGIAAPFVNEGPTKSGIYKLKFAEESRVVPFYASEMATSVKKLFSDIKFDYICPVPTTLFKIGKRGYNQSELLAKQLSHLLDIEMETKALKRKITSQTQHHTKNVRVRYKNAYASYKPGLHKVYGNVLLVDDIVTSRATVDSCALYLLKNGADRVYVIAATMSHKNNLN